MFFCGYPPFNADTDEEIHQRIRSNEPHVFPEEDWKNVSSQVKDLINHAWNGSRKRITAQDALSHVWIKSLADDSNPEFHSHTSSDIFKRLRTGQACKFQRTKRYIAESMHDHEIDNLRKAFVQIDKDGSGTITHDELKSCIEQHLHAASSKSSTLAKQALKIMDINGDSKVNYIEFVAATMEQKQWATVEHLHYAFDKLDSTHSGNLTREELFNLLGVRALASARPPFLLLQN